MQVYSTEQAEAMIKALRNTTDDLRHVCQIIRRTTEFCVYEMDLGPVLQDNITEISEVVTVLLEIAEKTSLLTFALEQEKAEIMDLIDGIMY